MTRLVRLLVRRLATVAARLRSSQLAVLAGALFLLDLLIPDIIPFADEILLGLLTLWLARRKDRGV